MSISFIVPTFNEKDNIVNLVDKIIFYVSSITTDYEIIIVDDNSSDKTGYFCIDHFNKNKKVRVFIRKKDRGFARSILFGLKNSRKEYVFVMDADFSHNPKLIPQMVKKVKNYTVILASRYVKKGGGENRSRFWLSKVYNIYLFLLLRLKVSDLLFGYFCVKRDYLIKNNLLRKDVFYGFGDYFIRFAYLVNKKGGTFYEIPAYYKNRIYGSSKSNLIKMLITYTLTSFKVRSLR